jgi:hypothetical protein
MADKTPSPRVTQPKVLPFYNSELENLAEPARKLLENYSGIAPADVVPHIKKVVRDILISRNSCSTTNNIKERSRMGSGKESVESVS